MLLLDVDPTVGVDWVELLESLGVAGSTTWLRIETIHSCCNSSIALARCRGSRKKHLFKKSIP